MFFFRPDLRIAQPAVANSRMRVLEGYTAPDYWARLVPRKTGNGFTGRKRENPIFQSQILCALLAVSPKTSLTFLGLYDPRYLASGMVGEAGDPCGPEAFDYLGVCMWEES